MFKNIFAMYKIKLYKSHFIIIFGAFLVGIMKHKTAATINNTKMIINGQVNQSLTQFYKNSLK